MKAHLALALSALLLAAAATVATPATAQPASLVGSYDGRQMEMAAGLELRGDGRFRYGLAYGALDEAAAGRWTARGDQVLLTSDPVTAPRFVLVSQGRTADGVLLVSLDAPQGMSRQYFDVLVLKANGQAERKQLSEDGLSSPFTRDNPPSSIRMLFPVFQVIGDPVRLDPSSGYAVRFRLEPNDLGKVAFQATPLKVVNGELLLDRHGRTIRFKRSKS